MAIRHLGRVSDGRSSGPVDVLCLGVDVSYEWIEVNGENVLKSNSPYAKDWYRASKLVDSKDTVNHPNHYKTGGIETIDFIEAKGLGFHLGNVVKYVTRADHKGNRLEDLKKARWYLDREILRAEGRPT